jgi:hypothetical protein
MAHMHHDLEATTIAYEHVSKRNTTVLRYAGSTFVLHEPQLADITGIPEKNQDN